MTFTISMIWRGNRLLRIQRCMPVQWNDQSSRDRARSPGPDRFHLDVPDATCANKAFIGHLAPHLSLVVDSVIDYMPLSAVQPYAHVVKCASVGGGNNYNWIPVEPS